MATVQLCELSSAWSQGRDSSGCLMALFRLPTYQLSCVLDTIDCKQCVNSFIEDDNIPGCTSTFIFTRQNNLHAHWFSEHT